MKHSYQFGKKYGFLFFWTTLCLTLFMGCETASNEPQHWQISASGNVNLYPIVHDDLIVLASKCENTDCLRAIRLDTGMPVWSWQDPDSLLHKSYYNLKHYVFDDILLLPTGSRLLAINLLNGKLLWQDKRKWPGESFLEGVGSTAFRTYYDNDNQLVRILAFDIITGFAREINTFSSPAEGRLSVRSPVIVPLDRKDTICISSTIHFIPKKTTKSRLIFWPLNAPSLQDTLEGYPDNSSGDGVTQQGIVDGTRSYWVAGNQLFCVDLETRRELWRDTFPHQMLTSRLRLKDHQLFYACENERLYAVDARNGQELWQCPIAGTPSRVYVDKDKIFLIGGSDGNLYIIDQRDGALLFKYHPASLGLGKESFFRRTFYAGNNMLVVTDYENWYAFIVQEDGSVEPI